jgi:hypothetical protein
MMFCFKDIHQLGLTLLFEHQELLWSIQMKFRNKLLFIAQLALAAGLSMNALAQNQGSPIPQGPLSANGKPPHLSEQQKSQMQARRAEHRAKRLQELKVFLQLQGNQEAAWSSFYAVMQKPMVKTERLKPEELEKLSTPERIEKIMAVKAERDSQVNQRMTAVKTFYASLNAQQQKVFDTHALAAIQRFGMSQQPRGDHHWKMHH